MPNEIKRQSDLNMRAARERLAQFQADSRRKLDDEALKQRTERLGKVQECYTPEVLQRINEIIATATGSIAARAEITNEIILAAGIMVINQPQYAMETRHRRKTEQANLRQINEDLIWLAYNLLQSQKTDAEHIEAQLFVLSQGYRDLLSSAATMPDTMSKHEMAACIAKYFYHGAGLSAKEMREIEIYIESSPEWRQGLLQLLLHVHAASMHVIDDKDQGISGSRGAPRRIDRLTAVRSVARSCDNNLGTGLLKEEAGKKKPYTWFLSLCEAGLAIPLTPLLGKMSMVSPVNSVLYPKGRKNRGVKVRS